MIQLTIPTLNYALASTLEALPAGCWFKIISMPGNLNSSDCILLLIGAVTRTSINPALQL
jgi:hypothetical protein